MRFSVQGAGRCWEAPEVDDESLFVGDKVHDCFKHLSVCVKEEPSKKKKKEERKNVQALKKRFFGTVRDFYDQALAYAKNIMPLSQSILKNAEFTDTTLRNTVEFT